jgi:hypothetical protein
MMLATLAEDHPEEAVAATEDALEGWWSFLTEVETDAA